MGHAAVDQRLSDLNTWRTSHCGLPPGDRVADRTAAKGRQGWVLERGNRCNAHKGFGTISASKGVCRGALLVPASWPKGALQQRMVPACRALCFLGLTGVIGELQIQQPLLYWDRARQPSTSIAAIISSIAIRKSSSPSPSLSLQR